MESLLTVAEFAPLVRLSRQATYRAIRAKQIAVIRIGSRIRVPQSEIQRLIEQADTNRNMPPRQDAGFVLAD